jgi:hypothetical protein
MRRRPANIVFLGVGSIRSASNQSKEPGYGNVGWDVGAAGEDGGDDSQSGG